MTTSQPLPATCSHLQPPDSHLQLLAQAATGSHWQPLAQAASCCSHLLQPLAQTANPHVVARQVAAASSSKWLHEQVAASDSFFENQNDARLLALCESLPRMFQGTDALIIHLFSGENQQFGTSR